MSEEVNGAAIWDLSLRSMSEMAADVGDAELIGAFADLRTAGEALQEGDPDADIFGAMRKVQFACKNLLDDEDAAAIAE